MTPPDSGERMCGSTIGDGPAYRICTLFRNHAGQHRDGNVTAWDQKPDSGEREIPQALAELDRKWALEVGDRYERGEYHCPCGAVLTQEHPRCWIVADPLAQRILAALENPESPGEVADVVAELRARLPK